MEEAVLTICFIPSCLEYVVVSGLDCLSKAAFDLYALPLEGAYFLPFCGHRSDGDGRLVAHC